MLKTSTTLYFLIFLFGTANAQNITFVDANFKNALLNHTPVIDINSDGEISLIEAAATTSLNIYSKSISNINEVSYFTSITSLTCYSNQLTSLEFTNHPKLTSIDCKFNSLTSINLSGCAGLQQLYANNNSLTSIDLSNNESLGNSNFYLDLRTNPLSSICITPAQFKAKQWGNYPPAATWDTLCGANTNFINFTDNNFKQALLTYSTKIDLNNDGNISTYEAKKLISLTLNNKNITDLSGFEYFTNVISLNCSDNNLSTINTSKNLKLEELWCSNNKIANLDLSKNSALRVVVCKNNLLQDIDLTSNSNLTAFHANNNLFTYIDYRDNSKLDAFSNELADNPNLKMICVTSAHLSNNTYWTKPDKAIYSTTCDTNDVTYINFPDSNFKASLLAETKIDDINHAPIYKIDQNLDGEISYSEAAQVGSIMLSDLTGFNNGLFNKIDLTGIEYFINLYGLFLNSQEIKNVNKVTQLQKIEILGLLGNKFDSLTIQNHPKLISISLASSGLKYLNLENCKIESMQVCCNKLENLDLSSLKNLKQVVCKDNPLISICVLPSHINNVEWTKDASMKFDTICGQNTIPIKDKKVLASLLAHEPKIDLNGDSIITVEEALKVKTLNITYLNLPNLDGFEAFKNITTLNVSGNALTKIDVTVFAYLKKLYAAKNYITIFSYLTTNINSGGRTQGEEPENTSLEVIDLSDNNLLEMDVSPILALDSLNVSGNSNLDYVCVNTTQLSNKTIDWVKDANTQWSIESCLRTTSVESVSNTFMPAYPNPAENQIFVSEKVQGIYSISGSLVQSFAAYTPNIKLNLCSGMYYIKYESGKTEKLLVK